MPVSSGASGIRPGTVAHFAAATAPAGWIKANGAAVSRTAYAGLFLAIGTTYGAGDGTTTFNVPDLRGEFLRGLDDGRGVDAGRVIGTAQADQLKEHRHKFSQLGTGAGGYLSFSPTDYGNEVVPAISTQRNSPGELGFGVENRPRNVALLACIKF